MPVISTSPRRWIGFTNDPADVDAWTFWAHMGRWTFWIESFRPHLRRY